VDKDTKTQFAEALEVRRFHCPFPRKILLQIDPRNVSKEEFLNHLLLKAGIGSAQQKKKDIAEFTILFLRFYPNRGDEDEVYTVHHTAVPELVNMEWENMKATLASCDKPTMEFAYDITTSTD
jgi:hypothetical protein